MVWILVVFAISLYILKKAVFPRITAALDERRASIDESIDAAERTPRTRPTRSSPNTASG